MVVSPHNRHLLFKIQSVKVWDPSMSHDSWSGHPKNRENFGTVKRANHSVCFITAQLSAGANEK